MVCVNSVCVTPRNLTLKVGDWYYGATADICPCDATNQCVTWHSDNTNVATVNAANGYIYAKATGTANIYATATDGSGCNDYLTITVCNTIPVGCIALNCENVSVERGNCYSLAATVCPENATNKTLCWSSSNPNVATVCNGVVCAVANGVANIAASATDGSGKSATCRVTVTGDTLVSSITVSPSNKTMTKGSSAFLYASVSPANATNKCVTWSSSNPNVATVNPTSGLVLAKNAGTAYIYATAQDGSGVVGSCILTVPTPVSVTGITVSPKLKTLGEGETAYLHATVCPCNATNQTVTWSSDDTSVATVGTYTGIVTPVFSGNPSEEPVRTVTITATTVDGGHSDSCTVTVDSREKVIVEKQTGNNHSRMIFEDGRIWNCINFDIINDYTLNQDDPESQRFYDNVYTTRIDDVSGHVYYQGPLKTYSTDEIKLLYSIDPYGLAAYVREYAASLPLPTDGVQERLSKILGYKDLIFSVLFGCAPKYYARTLNGEWYETTYRADLRKVMSESEFIFGGHPIYDGNTTMAFITVIVDAIEMLLQFNLISGYPVVKALSKVAKYYSMIHSATKAVIDSDFHGFLTAIKDGVINDDWLDKDLVTPALYKSQNYTMGWATDLLSFSSDLETLANTFNSGPHFYKRVIGYCADDLNYCVLLRTSDHQLLSLSSICDVIQEL